MKNSSYSYTYTVNLSIFHPNRELSYLAKELEAVSIGSVGKGIEKEDILKDRQYNEIKTNRVSFELNYNWNNALLGDDLPTAVEKIVDEMQVHSESLLGLVSDGGILSMRIGWHMDSNIGTSFDHELLRKLADLKISLDFFVYMSDEVQDIHTQQLNLIAEKIRPILQKYDPSKIINTDAALGELHFDPYQDLFDLLPYYVKYDAPKETMIQVLNEQLTYFNRTNTTALSGFTAYEALVEEIKSINSL